MRLWRELSEKKTTLLSHRNQDWKTVKAETEKVNDLLRNIPTNNITELNELIYAGAIVVCEKIGVPLKNTNRKSKPEWEFWLETHIRNLRQQAKMLRLKKNMRLCWDEERTATQLEQKIQLEEVNPKVLEKEESLNRYWDRKREYRQNRTFQNNERKFCSQVGWEWAKTY